VSIRFVAIYILLLFLPLSASATAPQANWHTARTVLQDHCIKCHGGVEQKGGLDLRSIESTLKGGDSGPAVTPGDADASLLLEMLRLDAETPMPPKGDPLTSEQVTVLTEWVLAMGDESKATSTHSAFLPEGLSPQLAIDVALERSWLRDGYQPSARISDTHYVRRITLDLLGRIPTGEERQTFLAATDSNKRQRLVDKLLKSSEHARHLAEIFDIVLLGRSERLPGSDRPLGRDDTWHAYLRWAFSSNRSWNTIVRDLIIARPSSDLEKGASWFLYAHKDDHQSIAASVAPKLLGKQIGCAQCHDHPIIPEIEQGHYWGMVAFFNRSYNVQTPAGPRLGEHAVGGNIQFSNLESESFDAKLAFLTGETVTEPEPEAHVKALYSTPPPKKFFEALNKPKDRKKQKRKDTPRYDTAPVPQFSRREQFAKLAIERNPDFSKAFVNRIWAMLLGRGLVHPVEHIDSIHPPSHPELLTWLSQDFANHGYNVRRLIRAIVASKVYQLDSVPAAKKRPPEASFACGITKPLSAEVLLRSLLIASGRTPGPDGSFAGVDEPSVRALIARVYPDMFSEIFSPRASEALLYSNNATLDALLDFGEGSLLESLSTLATVKESVQRAFLRVHGRETAAEELAACISFVGDQPDRFKHVLWSLVTSSEFRFNH
jgi:mono/diheme cytochrome c family protein